jgi:hypothetical protein
MTQTAPTTGKRLFTIEELSTEEGRRAYYRIDLQDPSTLHNNCAEPWLNPAYNEELKKRYGCDIHGDQIVKISWAASLRAVAFKDIGFTTLSYTGRKYPFMGGYRLKVTTGFSYYSVDTETGESHKVTVPSLDKVPFGKVWTEEFAYDDLGARKWVVEMKYTVAQMVRMGWCPPPDTPEGEQWCVRQGKRYRIAPDPKGEYVFGFFIEHQVPEEGEYRDVTQADVDAIHAIFNRALNETDEERATRKMAEHEKLQKHLKRSELERDAVAWDEAFTRVFNKKQGVVYGIGKGK